MVVPVEGQALLLPPLFFCNLSLCLLFPYFLPLPVLSAFLPIVLSPCDALEYPVSGEFHLRTHGILFEIMVVDVNDIDSEILRH